MRVVWSRMIAGLFWWATALYALLSAIPFASEQFLKPGLVPALVQFAAWHRWIDLAALAAVAAGLLPWLKAGHRGARAFVAAWMLGAAALIVAPPISRLEPTPLALVLALGALVPPFWISLMALPSRTATMLPRSAGEDEGADVAHDFTACALAAAVVTAVHAVSVVPRVTSFGARAASFELVRSLVYHLIAFSTVFAGLCVIRGAARLASPRETVEGWLARCALAAVFALFAASVVLRPLSLTGGAGTIAAIALGAALAATVGPHTMSARDGVDRALGGLVPAWAVRSATAATAWLCVLAIGVVAVERFAAVSDWNFAIAKSAAFASWLFALALSLRLVPAQMNAPQEAPFAVCIVLLVVYQAAPSAIPLMPQAADAWKVRDPSMRLIADALSPATVSDAGLEDFLQRNTNIAHSRHVPPVAIDLAMLDGPPARVRPHIFLFVIDSLRRDYLSPYNSAVRFTPAIAAFARESTVFTRAFTRYGATGLSVPSIWVGGLLLHKQYVTPFAPMNTLAKLLDHEQYRQWIGMDNILDVILPTSSRREPLDGGRQVADYRFCRTLDEIRGRLPALAASAPPTFVYSLPQDIHIATITREGATPVDNEPYEGFYAPYASRLRRLDACFGAFVADLKARGLYDSSLIIVTADHGDSLGEQGRMGHAYTIFPEVLQVPLIVHLPSDKAAEVAADASAPAFTTDLTPTLYALLGHQPRVPRPFFGRPLFRRKGDPPPPPRLDPQITASSYGNVYGALLGDARRLYIVDGVAMREYEYDIDGSGAGRSISVVVADRQNGQRAIRDTVVAIAELYGFQP